MAHEAAASIAHQRTSKEAHMLVGDLINIPERVRRGGFVLNLASGLAPDASDRTLRDYVTTPQLARCFGS